MPHLRTNHSTRSVISISFLLAAAAAAYGIQPAEKKADLQKLVFARPELHVPTAHEPLDRLPAELGAKLKGQLDLLGALEAAKATGYYDLRAGRWGTIIQSRPLVPGPGNQLQWSGIRTAASMSDQQYREAVWESLKRHLESQKGELRIDLAELASEPTITLLEDRRVVQVNAPRSVDRIPVRGSYLSAVVNSGNLILFGTRHWGDINISTQPSVAQSVALRKVAEYLRPHQISGHWRETYLEILPVSAGDDLSRVKAGEGYAYRLVWVVSPRIAADRGSWEALVDAGTGELLQFADRNSYFDRKITGGVYPISNDGSTPEEPGWPMPYADVVQPFGTGFFANSNGLVDDAGGLLRTTLNGKYVRMNDQCGEIDDSMACSDLDLGSGPGTDCEVPPGRSAGDTHSSRTGFYEVNRIIEMARGWLPENAWLQAQITANMNIPEECNAFWDGLTINFYQSGTSGTNVCRNTGEIPAVFDHEWGHGMDDNDALPEISLPGEAPADMYSMLRLNTSCIAQGFFLSNSIGGFCTGAGDPCTVCTGVRDADWAKRRSGLPHDIAWILSSVRSPGVPGVRPSGGCVGAVIGPPPPIPTVNSGPCGQSTHCEGNVVSEAIWDLVHRDLTSAPFNLDVNTALNLVARLQYLGGGNVNFWFQCVEGGIGGCNADGGYLNYLAIDDDDGNLENGTPHMTAIFNAYDRHQMACPTPTPQDGGCAGNKLPGAVPTVTVTPLGNGARVSWNAVSNATEYWVFRTDGIHGCDFGKERVAITTATQFTDTGLLDGREYFYTVEAVGASDSCRSAASACATVVPAASPVESEALLAFREVPNALTIQSGDGDPFVDNCETARFSFQVENAGTVGLSDVRLVRVTPVSHPETQVLTSLPVALASSLAGNLCGGAAIAAASFTFVPQGVGNEEPLDFEFEIQATSAEFGPINLVGRLRLTGTESDFQFFSSKTFSFETDFEGWNIVRGTYTRQSPGAPPTLFHLASSSFTAGQCDEIQSPQIKLTASSTLSLSSQFVTEPGTEETGFYDRANVGIVDLETEARATISPDGGLRPYNATGANGVCVTAGESGWAGGGPGFLPSTWSATALDAAARAGRRVRIDVAYGTDPLVEGAGFQFDEVTLTDVEVQVPDAKSDACPAPPRPDLVVSAITTSNSKAREGEKVTITATVTNVGEAHAGPTATATEFRLDGTTVLGSAATPIDLAPDASTSVSIQWDTRSVKGQHVIAVTADAGGALTESDDGNNTSTLTVTVQGNKVKNGSFEQPNASGSGPDGWSGEPTGAGSATWSDGGSDGAKSAGASGNGGSAATAGSPSWTSDPIAVTPGEALTFTAAVSAANASSAATAGLVYLGAAGNVLQTVNLLTAPLTTAGFAKLEQAVTIPAGVTQVRVKLVGFAPTDVRTSGTVRFDEVGLFGN